jgi:nucleoside phosphorylase
MVLRQGSGPVPTRSFRLREIVDQLQGVLGEPTLTVYLFGSRKDRTGSFRSDVDLVVPLARRVSEQEAQQIWDLEPYLDVFRLDRGAAESLINESRIEAETDPALLEMLGAVPLLVDGVWQPSADQVDDQVVLAERNPAATVANLYNLFDAVPAERADLLVVTALTEEYESVLTTFGVAPTGRSTLLSQNDDSDSPWLIRVVNLMEMGSVGAAIKTYEALQRTKAPHVVLVGLCAGVPKKVDLLDVIVPSKVLFYEPGKVGARSVAPSHESRDCDEAVLAAGAALALKMNAPHVVSNQVVLGCGEKVVGSRKFRKRIEAANRKLVAVDMESYGVLRAAQGLHRRATVIKSVCDFADEKKSDSNRDQARLNAALTLKAFVVGGAFRQP